jgi:prepilin-type N-terminal cleavage/methylation domain-containing protein
LDRRATRQTSQRTARDDRGFTIIESITAAAILLVVAAGVVTVLITTAGWYSKATVRTMASTVANKTMSVVLSRNSSELHYADAGQEWPTGIPFSRPETTTLGVFSVETSMAPAIDPATQVLMTRVTVTVNPEGQELDPPVQVVRYASGWQQTAASTTAFYVTVKVQLMGLDDSVFPDGEGMKGARVQLLDADTLGESYYATTNDSGVATFYKVLEGQYYLTSDPRFGTDIRPLHFPMRISPTHGGSVNNPIMSVNSYELTVVRSANAAMLRVGAFKTEGWTVVNGQLVNPEVPYKLVTTQAGGPLEVYASPVLNAGEAQNAGFYGMGDEATLYPLESKLPIYRAMANAYGVAPIQIPYTTDEGEAQYWKVWCRTKDAAGVVTVHTLTTDRPGGWESRVQRPEGAFDSDPQYCNIVQFPRLGEGATAVNDPTMPAFP